MEALRSFLSTPHQKILERTGLLDRPAMDPLLQERFLHIQVQILSALVLRDALIEVGSEEVSGWNSIDLLPMIALAKRVGLLDERGAAIFRSLNTRGNIAKHELEFPSLRLNRL